MFDYSTLRYFGPVMIVIRGLVRPVASFMLLYFDFLYFTLPNAEWTSDEVSLLKMLNLIIWLFWFGEKLINSPGVANIIEKFLNRK